MEFILYNLDKVDMHATTITYWQFLPPRKKRKCDSMALAINEIEKNATKRVAVKPSTWEALSNLRKPGETFDELLVSLITTEQRQRLHHDLEVATAEPSIPWREAAKQLGL
jgi:hypothetical protein